MQFVPPVGGIVDMGGSSQLLDNDIRKRVRDSPNISDRNSSPSSTQPIVAAMWAAQPRSHISALVHDDDSAVVPLSPMHLNAAEPEDSQFSESKRIRVFAGPIENIPAAIGVEIIRLLCQPAEVVPADSILPMTVAVAMPLDSPQLFVQVHTIPVGIGGSASVAGLTLVEVRKGIADFRKLRIVLPEHAQAAQLQLIFTLSAIVHDKLQPLDASVSTSSRSFIVAAVDAPLNLHTAASTGNAERLMTELMSADINSADVFGRTPLHCAATSGQSSIVRLLLAAGASVGARDVDGDTALHAAALAGSVATITHLLDAGADANAVNITGCTPLHYAACAQSADVFQLLVFRGAVVSRTVGVGGASAGALFPAGLDLVQQSIAHKETELRRAIRSGALFTAASPVRSTRAAGGVSRPASAPSVPAIIRASAAGGDPFTDSGSEAEENAEDVVDSDDASGDWVGGRNTASPTNADAASARAVALAATAPVMLRVVGGFEPPVFKDSPLRIRLVLAPNVQAGGTARDVQRLLSRQDGRFQVGLTLEDAHGGAVSEVAKGRRSGARIVNQDEVEVQTGADGVVELANVRIREVSRNHAGGAFRLVFSLLGVSADLVVPAVTRPFHVLSERIRAPSYRNQISRQRERRMRRAQSASAPPQPGSPDETESL